MAATEGTEEAVDGSKLFRVSARSAPDSLASAIAHQIYTGNNVTLRAIGAGAVNQSVKATIIAASFAAAKGIRLNSVAGFATVQMAEGEVSAIVFKVSAA